MLFSEFSQYLQQLETTPSRIAMTEILAELFQKFENDEVVFACYLMQGRLVPKYESLEFQLSVKMILRALSRLESELSDGSEKKVSGESQSLFAEVDDSFSPEQEDSAQKDMTQRYKKIGDLGILAEEIVAEHFSKNGADDSLTITQVYKKLVVLAEEGGTGSQERKLDQLVTLFKEIDPVSAKFVARIIIGKLRLGFSTMTMFDALSWAKYGDKSFSKNLEMAYQKKADIGKLAQAYLQNTVSDQDQSILDSYAVEAGVPVVPALCQRLNTAQEIIDKMKEVIVEPKYDGLRVQIHFQRAGFENGTQVRAFTRNLEDVSHMFPELHQLKDVTDAETLILDSEAIGYDTETGNLLPFQETITRKRKHDIEHASEKVPIKFFVFDVLYLNGKEHISEPLLERKETLKKVFQDGKTFTEAPYLITKDPQQLREYHEEQLANGLEGAVMKKVSSRYLGGRKGWRWVKIKEEEGTSGKLKDTLDVVVMGYYFGRGKRSQFGIGALLVGVLDDDGVKTIAKIGTGLTEERLVSLKNKCDEIQSSQKPKMYIVDDALSPDVWAYPELVIEVAADEITRSPNHTAGVALRFPRLMTVRKDKSWQEATTLKELESF